VIVPRILIPGGSWSGVDMAVPFGNIPYSEISFYDATWHFTSAASQSAISAFAV